VDTPADEVAARAAARLGEIDGVAAVVLGGSRGRGAARPDSDVDLGVYYHPSHLPSRAALQAAATELDDLHRDGTVTGFGDWGPWVNGGAWLQIDGHAVDWLFRDVARVTQVIEDARAGRVSADYYLGHPHAFHSYIYLGEVATCRPLQDRDNVVTALKVLVAHYPPALRTEVVRRYSYDARFMLEVARKPAGRGDVFEVAGCLFRVAAVLVQVLFALNETYFLNEKGAVEAVDGMRLHPAGFGRRVQRVLGAPGTTAARLLESVERFDQLIAEVDALCRDAAVEV